ncbi:MAG TPA: adenylyltransferase/cytidyltransferase family protein [Opitutaceae bacterium]|nr:adenylyltransferase/cytidyltransferase family protein [Opitutaceae bacterium]
MKLDDPKLKVRSLENALIWRDSQRRERRPVVLTNGVFDLLHTGHLHFLHAARNLGGALVVLLNDDASVRTLKGPLRPVQTQEQRAFALASLACVDCVVAFHTPRLDAEIRALRPDKYCKAGDYSLDKLDRGERTALEEVGAEIEFLKFLPGFSTTSLIAKIKAAGEI